MSLQMMTIKPGLTLVYKLLGDVLYKAGRIEQTRWWCRKTIEVLTLLDLSKLPERTTYYNETRNDRWIVEYVFPGKRRGYFIEAGAANGREASSCYVLEKQFAWTGICIEPNNSFFASLVENRPNSICENQCLAGESGNVIYIEGDWNPINPYLSGIKSNLERFKHGGEEIVKKGKEVSKSATTLEQLLRKYNSPRVIDYAAFDIEGSELKVLEGFPFDRYRFLALSLECDGLIWKSISHLLQPRGYKEVKNPFNREQPWERYFLHKSIV